MEESAKKLEESAKDMEASTAKQKELTDALTGLLGWTAADDQQPENLESKMDEALDHGEPALLLSLAEPDVAQQVITEASERSAFRPSRRDTNSPEEFEPVARGTTQDVRGRTRPGQIQEYFNHQQDYDQRADAEEELSNAECRRRLRILEQEKQERLYQSELELAMKNASEARTTNDRVGTVRKSFGGPQKAIAMYDSKNKVEAINGLELLTTQLKSHGLKNCQLIAVTPTEVYKWIEACDRVSKLYDVFFHFFQALIVPDVWTAIQAWNGARKQDHLCPEDW